MKKIDVTRPMIKKTLFFILFFLVFFLPVIRAFADNWAEVGVFCYDNYNSDGMIYGYTDTHNSVTNQNFATVNYSSNDFSGTATSRVNGLNMGVFGEARVSNNSLHYYEVVAAAELQDTLTFSESQTFNIAFQLDGFMWRNQVDSHSQLTPIVYAYMNNTWQFSNVSAPDNVHILSVLEPDPASIEPDHFTGLLKLAVIANTPYDFRLVLANDLLFKPGYLDYPYNAYSATGGFNYLNTLTLTDFFLTDENGERVPFTYTSSNGIIYPTTSPTPAPESPFIIFLAFGLVGLVGVREKIKDHTCF